MSKLAEKKCVPCEGGTPTLPENEQLRLQQQLNDGWRIEDQHHLVRNFKFKNFKDALNFTTRVGEVAENEGHHPTIVLDYGKVKVLTWTHKAGGLTENDFILAAKIDEICE